MNIDKIFTEESPGERYKRAKRSIYNPDLRFIVGKRDLVGALAKWAVKQSPYDYPENLEKVIDAFADHIDIYFDPKVIYGYKWFQLLDLEDFIEANLKTIPELLDWNERKNKREGHGFTSIADAGRERDPDDDFIDLHALYSNIAHDLYNDAVSNMSDEDYKKNTEPRILKD